MSEASDANGMSETSKANGSNQVNDFGPYSFELYHPPLPHKPCGKMRGVLRIGPNDGCVAIKYVYFPTKNGGTLSPTRIKNGLKTVYTNDEHLVHFGHECL